MADGAKSVGALGDLLGVEQSLLSHHLQTLRHLGLVESARQGKTVVYRLARRPEVLGKDMILDLQCCRLLLRSARGAEPGNKSAGAQHRTAGKK